MCTQIPIKHTRACLLACTANTLCAACTSHMRLHWCATCIHTRAHTHTYTNIHTYTHIHRSSGRAPRGRGRKGRERRRETKTDSLLLSFLRSARSKTRCGDVLCLCKYVLIHAYVYMHEYIYIYMYTYVCYLIVCLSILCYLLLFAALPLPYLLLFVAIFK